jgi:hypothetical protein
VYVELEDELLGDESLEDESLEDESHVDGVPVNVREVALIHVLEADPVK